MSEPAPEPYPDDQAVVFADALLACLCAQLVLSKAGAVCSCCLRPGAHLVPMDSCSCSCDDAGSGQASVQVTNFYPSNKFPRQGVDSWDEPCQSAVTWVAELTMTVYRCVSVFQDDGQPPVCADLDRDMRKIQSDRAAMMRAWACCDWRGVGDDAARVSPGSWTPVPPKGGCAGGFMTVLVDVGSYCCPAALPG